MCRKAEFFFKWAFYWEVTETPLGLLETPDSFAVSKLMEFMLLFDQCPLLFCFDHAFQAIAAAGKNNEPAVSFWTY